jgi:bifunctional enzyme CysN/CysC
MIAFGLRRATNVHLQGLSVSKLERTSIKHHQPAVLWFTGLSGSGKSTIANIVESRLWANGLHTILLDGDNVRHGLNKDLSFTEADRVENIRRIGEVAKLMTQAGLIVLCSFISPFRAERRMVRELLDPREFFEIYVATALDDCIKRDPKGLYKKAMAGEIKNFTGIGQAYEPPEEPELAVGRGGQTAAEAVAQVLALLKRRGVIGHIDDLPADWSI